MKGVLLGCLVSLAVLVLLFVIVGSLDNRPIDYNAPGNVRTEIYECIDEFRKYPGPVRFSLCMADKGYTRKSGCDDKDEAHCWERKEASYIK